MILNRLLSNNDRIEIIEAFLENEEYPLSLEDIETISDVHININKHLQDLLSIGIIVKEDNNEYKLNTKNKEVICLRYIYSYEYLRQLEEVYDSKDIQDEQCSKDLIYSNEIKSKPIKFRVSNRLNKYGKLGV